MKTNKIYQAGYKITLDHTPQKKYLKVKKPFSFRGIFRKMLKRSTASTNFQMRINADILAFSTIISDLELAMRKKHSRFVEACETLYLVMLDLEKLFQDHKERLRDYHMSALQDGVKVTFEKIDQVLNILRPNEETIFNIKYSIDILKSIPGDLYDKSIIEKIMSKLPK